MCGSYYNITARLSELVVFSFYYLSCIFSLFAETGFNVVTQFKSF